MYRITLDGKAVEFTSSRSRNANQVVENQNDGITDSDLEESIELHRNEVALQRASSLLKTILIIKKV